MDVLEAVYEMLEEEGFDRTLIEQRFVGETILEKMRHNNFGMMGRRYYFTFKRNMFLVNLTDEQMIIVHRLGYMTNINCKMSTEYRASCVGYFDLADPNLIAKIIKTFKK